MATQNAARQARSAGFPLNAVLTTNRVQLTIDLATLLRGIGRPDEIARALRRARMTFPALAGFIAGCTAGGFLEVHLGLRALAVPGVLGIVAIPLGEHISEAAPAKKQAW